MAKTKQIEFITTFSRFISTRLLGEGGSGFVYEVKDDNGQKFAVKLLKRQGVTTDNRRRFENEIRFCQRASHPNIISIIDSGVLFDNDVAIPYYVMPFYDSSLRNLINNGIKPEIIIRLFSQLLDGMEAAHLQDIVHRDIKPENILYKTTDTQLVLADFGIARFTEDELYTAVETKAQDRLANFQYAAPEQRVRGRNIDNRADIFAIGLILNEMFTHEIPQGTGYKTISSVSSEYTYLDEIVERMIRQNPEERFNSINEVKQLLKIRGATYISEQRLSKLRSIVIPTSEIDDPLVSNPIKIEDYEWDKGMLTLILSQPVNAKWINALLNMGSYTSVIGRGPETFSFEGNCAKVRSEEGMVQDLINYFKSWIPLVTERYKQDLQEEHRIKEEQELQNLKHAIEVEEAKVRLRKNIKL
ncbi:MAG: serine/threonine-protein kinase [Anaerolineaceae bacterium]